MQHLRKNGGGGYFTFSRFPASVPCFPFSRPRTVAIVGRGGNAHAAEFIEVILLVEHVPFLAAFQDFLLLRGDAFAHFQLDFFFVAQHGRQNLHDLLADGVAVVDEFHVVAVDQHLGDLVRNSDNFFAAQSHRPLFPTKERQPASRLASLQISNFNFPVSIAAPACGPWPNVASPSCTFPDTRRPYCASHPGARPGSVALRRSAGPPRSVLPSCACPRGWPPPLAPWFQSVPLPPGVSPLRWPCVPQNRVPVASQCVSSMKFKKTSLLAA